MPESQADTVERVVAAKAEFDPAITFKKAVITGATTFAVVAAAALVDYLSNDVVFSGIVTKYALPAVAIPLLKGLLTAARNYLKNKDR